MFEVQINRIKNLIISPKTEWEIINGEAVDIASLYKSWIMPLAAIPAIAGFIGTSLFGVGAPGLYARVPIFLSAFNGLLSFVLSLVGVYAFAHILNALAPYFGAQKNLDQALKLSAYVPVAAWLSGVFLLVPVLSILALIGALYTLYLLFVGLPVLMKPAKDKAASFALAAILAAILLSMTLGIVTQALLPNPMTKISRSDDTGLTLEQQSQAMEDAIRQGDLGGMIAAMSGGSAKTVTNIDAFKKLAPTRLAGLKRVSLDIKEQHTPVNAIILSAVYEGRGGRQITLTITNSPAVNFLKTVTGLTGVKRYVKEDDGSFERFNKKNDTLEMFKWDAESAKGTAVWSYLNFIVMVEGRDVPLKALNKAARIVSEADLDRLLRE